MSLLKKAIHARAERSGPEFQREREPSLESLKGLAVASLSAEGILSITRPGADGGEEELRREVERIFEWDSLPDPAVLLKCNEYMKWYEASRKAAVAKAAKSKSKSKKKHEGLEGVRERYV